MVSGCISVGPAGKPRAIRSSKCREIRLYICEKAIIMGCRYLGMPDSIHRITACKIRRFMVAWNHENERKGRRDIDINGTAAPKRIYSACVTYGLLTMILCAVYSKTTYHWQNLYYALSQISRIWSSPAAKHRRI